MHDLVRMCQQYGVASKGVIHVGAHDGQEVPLYQMLGMKRILLVEANPRAFHRLNSQVSSIPNIIASHCAVCSYDGFARLRVMNSDASSSLLPLKLHQNVFPEIKEDSQITVPARKLDTLFKELSQSPSDYSFLNIDIQGAELLAFEGALTILRHMEAVNTEVNFEELYEGCALIDQVDSFLGALGFERKETTRYHKSFGDAFYLRR